MALSALGAGIYVHQIFFLVKSSKMHFQHLFDWILALERIGESYLNRSGAAYRVRVAPSRFCQGKISLPRRAELDERGIKLNHVAESEEKVGLQLHICRDIRNAQSFCVPNERSPFHKFEREFRHHFQVGPASKVRANHLVR